MSVNLYSLKPGHTLNVDQALPGIAVGTRVIVRSVSEPGALGTRYSEPPHVLVASPQGRAYTLTARDADAVTVAP